MSVTQKSVSLPEPPLVEAVPSNSRLIRHQKLCAQPTRPLESAQAKLLENAKRKDARLLTPQCAATAGLHKRTTKA